MKILSFVYKLECFILKRNTKEEVLKSVHAVNGKNGHKCVRDLHCNLLMICLYVRNRLKSKSLYTDSLSLKKNILRANVRATVGGEGIYTK